MSDHFFRGGLAGLDPEIAELARHESARQSRYLILIPSESSAPAAVREALATPFHNLYAEGYPLESTRRLSQEQILDYGARLPEYRRLSDRRFYKGTEYANLVEALARRRTAELFANERISAEQLFVNVQPLSGAPANNAVYSALLDTGDTVMGMDLFQGGHLTHGSPANRSGINYRIVSYGVDARSERIDYDSVQSLAEEHRPKMIIAGASSYPFAPDFTRFRKIADAVGAYLLADIAHIAGLVAAGECASPVGLADVVTFTTHKTLNGPRGAIILSHRADLAKKLDRAVFPGEQGGPHINTIAAIAVCMRLAASEQFRALQRRTTRNARRLAARLREHGLRLPHGSTDTHLLLVDCASIRGADGTPLSGDMAARILDLAGIVLNRQTIPGDTSAFRPGGIRIGTPWISQRGFGDAEIDRLADILAGLLKSCVPFSYTGRRRPAARAKIDFESLHEARLAVRDLAASAGSDSESTPEGYPHFHDLDSEDGHEGWLTLEIRGKRARDFLHAALSSDVHALVSGQRQRAWLFTPDGETLSRALLEGEGQRFRLHVERRHGRVAAWLRALSDGFVICDREDVHTKLPGPVDVRVAGPLAATLLSPEERADWPAGCGMAEKAWFIGQKRHFASESSPALPPLDWQPVSGESLRQTPLHALHQRLGARMAPFAGYDMPLWYDSVRAEHRAVRQGAGIFDVSHMGVLELRGTGVAHALDLLTSNDVAALAVGASHYTFMLAPDGLPLDDLLIYRLAEERFMLVVNAANAGRVQAWLQATLAGKVRIDDAHPARRIENGGRLGMRDLRAAGAVSRVDLALQGPRSREILLALGGDEDSRERVLALRWGGHTRVTLGGFDLIVARTGYTGERVASELLVHPQQAAALFARLVELGATPCGLAARDSLRIEAGLPLYGHELAGPLALGPAEAGFGSFVRLYKPFFVGKAAFIAREQKRDARVAKFRLESRRARPLRQGDALLDERGRVVGIITSCAADDAGRLRGLALLRESHRRKGLQLQAVGAGPDSVTRKLRLGGRVALPQKALIE